MAGAGGCRVRGPDRPRRRAAALASAESTWQTTRRFLSFLSLQQPPPFSPGGLTAAHLDAFHAERSRTMSRRNALAELRRVLLLLEQQPLKAVLAPE